MVSPEPDARGKGAMDMSPNDGYAASKIECVPALIMD